MIWWNRQRIVSSSTPSDLLVARDEMVDLLAAVGLVTAWKRKWRSRANDSSRAGAGVRLSVVAPCPAGRLPASHAGRRFRCAGLGEPRLGRTVRARVAQHSRAGWRARRVPAAWWRQVAGVRRCSVGPAAERCRGWNWAELQNRGRLLSGVLGGWAVTGTPPPRRAMNSSGQGLAGVRSASWLQLSMRIPAALRPAWWSRTAGQRARRRGRTSV